MKVILIATDFSAAANNATIYGMEIARHFNANVILFNACTAVPIHSVHTPVVISPDEIRKIVQQHLLDEARILSARYKAQVSTCCKTGPAAHMICEAVKEHQVDLVIAGIKQKGKKLRKIFGNTITELLSRLKVPMIAIPEEVTYSSIINIALATDTDLMPDENIHILDTLREIGERFNSKLFLVRVANNQFQAVYEILNRPLQLMKITRTLHPAYECVEGHNFSMALNNFTKAYSITLLAMLPHQYTMLERFFTKSATRAMIFETYIPLLVLPGRKFQAKSN